MADYLKAFTEGERILASETNDNNQYLLKQITDTASSLTANINTCKTDISTVKNSVSNLNSAAVTLTTAQTVSGAKTFTGVTKVPNSAAVGTAIATAAISKGTNGYIKFGNGIIIQWGFFTGATGLHAITFSTSFSDTNYFAYSVFEEATKRTENSWGFASSKKTTGCTFLAGTSSTDKVKWLAIGY